MVRQPALNARHRPPLTRERIIEAALHIIDAQGLSRLTMRRLGDSLEVEAMAIYHHLPRGKEELLDGLVAHVAARPVRTRSGPGPDRPDAAAPGSEEQRETAPPAEQVEPVDWRATLRRWAEDYRARLLDHAGVLPLLVTRRNPPALAQTAASLQEVLRLSGSTEAQARTGAHVLLSYVIGHAALEVRGLAAATDAGADWEGRFLAGLDAALSGIAR